MFNNIQFTNKKCLVVLSLVNSTVKECDSFLLLKNLILVCLISLNSEKHSWGIGSKQSRLNFLKVYLLWLMLTFTNSGSLLNRTHIITIELIKNI
jgi:hypothetical protein